MRSLFLTLSSLLLLVVGCGSPARLFEPDAGTGPDPDTATTPVRSDAERVFDSTIDRVLLPEAAADTVLALDEGSADATPSIDGNTDSAPSPLDAPIPELDAPMLIPDAWATDADIPGTDAVPVDLDDGEGDARDAVSGNEHSPNDATPDGIANDSNDTPANLVVPEKSGTLYSFRFGDTVFAVDAAKGARIVTFSLGGRNLLTAARDASDINWGSTLWPSPQSDWSWPPPTEIDSSAYTASLTGATLTLTGATAGALGLSVTKTFTVDSVAGAVNIEYRISNRGTQTRSVAPWEVSRLVAGGLAFFPMGEGAPGKGSPPLLQLQLAGGVAWLAYDANVITDGQKVLADGSEGWIAQAIGNLLFVKAFGDITPAQAAPGEAEIELYADPTHTYVELEDQGALTSLAPGTSLSWSVRWFVRELDPSVPIEVGSAELLSTVRSLVQGP